MSMNLTLHTPEGVEVALRQTPTFITWMCVSYNFDTQEPDGGMEGVRRRYFFWLDGTLDGVWDSLEELDEARKAVEDHKAVVRAIQNPQFSYT